MFEQLQLLAREQVPSFFRWWGSELLSVAPQRLRTGIADRKARIALSMEDDHLIISFAPGALRAVWLNEDDAWPASDAVAKLKEFAGTRSVDLIVPKSDTLYQEVTLPLAARENLQNAVTYGLPTWSPFQPDEVYIAARIVRTTGQKIIVGIFYAVRGRIAPLLQRAQDAGFPPDRLAFDRDGAWTTDLKTAKSQRLTWQKRIDTGLIVSCSILMLILSTVLSWRQAEELAAYQKAVRQELSAAKYDETTRKSLDEIAARKTAVARKRGTQMSVSDILTGLGEKLPSPAILTSIEIGNGRGKIEVSGASGQELIKSLQDVSQISGPKFDSTIPGRPLSVVFGIREKTL